MKHFGFTVALHIKVDKTKGKSMDIGHTKQDKGFTVVEFLIVIVMVGILAVVTYFAVQGNSSKSEKKSKEASGKEAPVTESIWHMKIKPDMSQVTAADGTPVTEADLVQFSCKIAGGKAFYSDTNVFHVPQNQPELTTLKEELGAAGIPVYYWYTGEGGIVDSFVMSTTGLNFPITTDDARTVISSVIEKTNACDK